MSEFLRDPRLDGREHWQALFLPFGCRLAADVGLDAMEFAECMPCRFSRCTDVNIVDVSPGVVPACGLTDLAARIKIVEAAVGVGLQDALESGEMSLRMNAFAVRRVGKPDRNPCRRGIPPKVPRPAASSAMARRASTQAGGAGQPHHESDRGLCDAFGRSATAFNADDDRDPRGRARGAECEGQRDETVEGRVRRDTPVGRAAVHGRPH